MSKGTVSYELVGPQAENRVRKLIIDWTSDANGIAEGFITSFVVDGVILRSADNPADGADAPSDDYDLTLLDENGIDVLSGQGANRDTTNSDHVTPGVPLKESTRTSSVPVALCDKLELRVANAGSGKKGRLVIYLR